jgi:GT2 family glycosyltransferase
MPVLAIVLPLSAPLPADPTHHPLYLAVDDPSLKHPHIPTIVRDPASPIWADAVKSALDDGCDFIALMAPDALLPDQPCIDAAIAAFDHFAGAPYGFGSVALRDPNGLPTCPVLHRTHFDIFKHRSIPDISLDEIAEFFFQLYRRFGCSTILSYQVPNVLSDLDAKSFDAALKDWTFEKLDDATATAEAWLKHRGAPCPRVLTLDVVIPSFRVIIPYLRAILDLKPSSSCSVLFFIIIDNPHAPQIPELQSLYAHRADVRIRVNAQNMGTSATRNRGINESAAEWIHFLDDDIVPRKNLFVNVERHLRAHPDACGCVGVTDFPRADTIWQAALHISAAVYYFSVATRLPDDVPWSVSANLVARRSVRDGVRFKTLYPKTGGGEDIDFCLSKRAAAKARGAQGFVPAPDVRVVHPWWPAGRRAFWRFYVWSYGDEHLSRQFPQYTYLDYVPNTAESFFIALGVGVLALAFARWSIASVALKAALGIVLGNTLHDCVRHLFMHPERLQGVHTTVRGASWLVAVVESSFIRFFREIGWFHGMIDHGGYNFFRRFDINGGRLGTTAIEDERRFRMQKIVFYILCTLTLI